MLVLLIVAFTTVLAPALGRSGSLTINLLYAVMEWLLAWPFVARVALAPQILAPDRYPPGQFNPKRERSPVRYGPAVALGLAVDAVSMLPLFGMAAALHRLSLAPYLVMLGILVRLFVVLPAAIQLLVRRLHGATV